MPIETTRDSARANGPLILLADDEEVVRNVGRDILHILGYQVLLASNGMETASIYQQHQKEIALIILDWYMPGLSGLEVLDKIWAVDAKAKILIASGLGMPRELEAILDGERTVHMLQKPYLVKDLQMRIAGILKE